MVDGWWWVGANALTGHTNRWLGMQLAAACLAQRSPSANGAIVTGVQVASSPCAAPCRGAVRALAVQRLLVQARRGRAQGGKGAGVQGRRQPLLLPVRRGGLARRAAGRGGAHGGIALLGVRHISSIPCCHHRGRARVKLVLRRQLALQRFGAVGCIIGVHAGGRLCRPPPLLLLRPQPLLALALQLVPPPLLLQQQALLLPRPLLLGGLHQPALLQVARGTLRLLTLLLSQYRGTLRLHLRPLVGRQLGGSGRAAPRLLGRRRLGLLLQQALAAQLGGRLLLVLQRERAIGRSLESGLHALTCQATHPIPFSPPQGPKHNPPPTCHTAARRCSS